jgi:outer membrane protein TolC
MVQRLSLPTILLLVVGVLGAGSFNPAAAAELPVVNVGMVVDGPWEGNEYVRELTTNEIVALTADEFDVRFPDHYYLEGDWTLEGSIDSLGRLLYDPGVDLVITWGVLSSHAICCMVEISKPVIAPIILDIELQGVPFHEGASGVRNLSYVALPDTLADELQRFREVFPFGKVAILANRAILQAIPDLASRTEMSMAGLGIDFEYVSVGFSAEEALVAIPEDADAVFMYPQIQLPPEERSHLVTGLIERKLPSFTALGEIFVEEGLLAGLGAADFFPRMARRIAVNTQRILLGEAAGTIPVEISLREQLTINMETARAIGVSPTYAALLEANVLHADEVGTIRTLTLAEAVHEAIDVNLDLLARERSVAAGQEDVRRASSIFWPQLDIGALGLVIDEDRAIASFGSQPERSLTGSVGLTQLLFSDDALANKSIRTSLQTGREWDFETLRLDIAVEAGVTYLNLLRAQSLEQVQRNNVTLTRSNLELAEVRRSIGAANPAEVFRWESQLATDRKALVEAEASVQVAQIAVNRLLDRPLEERFQTEEVDLEKPWRVTGDPRIGGYIETPSRFRAFQDFAVEEGNTNAPELKVLAAALAAQERSLINAKRAYWAPLIAAEASLDEYLSKSGEGTEPPELPAGGLFPTPDDTLWSVGLSASLPLFTGWARKADRIQAEEELARLRLDYDAVAQRIEQRIRSGMEVARASLTGIGLARQAADAAAKNLELVTDAYARGAVSIIDLLDAQNASLNAEELATNATYDYLVDLLEVERAIGSIELLGTPETSAAFFVRLEEYFRERGLSPLEKPSE